MMNTYSYRQITERADMLNSMRDNNGCFIGSDEQLDEMLDLSIYNREKLGHALCLDFKTDVAEVNNEYRLLIEGKPCKIIRQQVPYTNDDVLFVYDNTNNFIKMYHAHCSDQAGYMCYYIKGAGV